MTIELTNNHKGVLRIAIKLWIPSKKAYVKTDAIFDTGAFKTILDEKLADLLNLPRNNDKNVVTMTAAGMVTTCSGNLPKLYLGTKLIHNIPVSIMNLPDELESYCILGMNVLQEFDISINNYDGIVTLIPKPLPIKYYMDNYSVTLASVEGGDFQDEIDTK